LITRFAVNVAEQKPADGPFDTTACTVVVCAAVGWTTAAIGNVIVGFWIVVDDNEAPVGFDVIDQLYVLPVGAVSDDDTVVVAFAHCVGVPTVIEPEGVV